MSPSKMRENLAHHTHFAARAKGTYGGGATEPISPCGVHSSTVHLEATTSSSDRMRN